MTNNNKNLGIILRQRRVMIPLTLREVSAKSGVSESHLARVERGDRFPSARILRKIAKTLDFSEPELLALADYLPSQYLNRADSFSSGQLDPYAAAVLSREPLEIQRTVVTVVSVLKNMAKSKRNRSSHLLVRG